MTHSELQTEEIQLTNPFPGLRPFDVSENYLFFGRDKQVDSLLKKLSQHRFVSVVGTSGSGKSSLVRAGLLPALYGGFMVNAGSTWRIAMMRPGSSPIRNLAEALSSSEVFGSYDEGEQASQLSRREETLETSSLGLVQTVRQAVLPADENLLLVVDQFEELFRFKQNVTIADAANEAAAFVKLLLEAVHQRELSIYVLLTIRSDFLGDCAQFRDLPEAINEGHYLIPRLRREQQREVILGPVAVGGAKISPRLVQQLLNDLGDNPDQLPILQHALMRTWDKWVEDHGPGEPIDLRHYDAIGKMAHALSEHADEAYNELPDERSRKLCELMFKCLTMRGPDNRGIRRPTKIREICAIAEATPAEIIRVVEYFRQPGRSFIMPPHGVPLTEDSVLDISHESLMRVWDRFVQWVNDDANSADMYLRIVESYKLHEKGEAGLWHDPELQQGLNWREKYQPNVHWADRYAPAFTEAMGFIDDSALQREREHKESKRRRRIVNAFVVAFLAFAGVLTVWALSERSSADRSAKLAFEQKREAEDQRKVAQTKKGQAEQSALFAQQQEQNAIAAKTEAEKQKKLAELRSGEALAQKSAADLARADAERSSNLANDERAAALRQSQVADSLKTIAEHSASTVSRLRLLSIAKALAVKATALHSNDPQLVSLLALQAYEFNHSNGGSDLDPDIFSAISDANRLVNASALSLNGGQGSSDIRSVVYTNSGDIISASIEGNVTQWRPNGTSRIIDRLPAGVRALALSPDERVICYAGKESLLHLYDLGSGQHRTLPTPASYIVQTAFVTNDRVAALNNEGKLFVVGVNGPVELTHPSDAGKILSFALDGKTSTLAAGLSDGNVLLWNFTSLTDAPRVITGAHAPLISIAFSPDGSKIAAGSERGTLALWDVRHTSERPQLLSTDGSPLRAVMFSPGSQMLAAASSNGRIRMWNSKRLNDLPLVVSFAPSWIWSIAFNRDGSTVAAANSDHNIHLIPTHASDIVAQLLPKVSRNLSEKEWEEYIGADIPYMKTIPSLSQSLQ